MGFYFRVHHDIRLVYKKVWGTYGDVESVASHEEWDALCAAHPGIGDYNEFQDLTQVTRYGVSLEQIRVLADRHEREWESGQHQPKQLCYVVPSPLAFGTGRVYGSLMAMTGFNLRVFNSMEEAADWLGLSAQVRDRIVEVVGDQ